MGDCFRWLLPPWTSSSQLPVLPISAFLNPPKNFVLSVSTSLLNQQMSSLEVKCLFWLQALSPGGEQGFCMHMIWWDPSTLSFSAYLVQVSSISEALIWHCSSTCDSEPRLQSSEERQGGERETAETQWLSAGKELEGAAAFIFQWGRKWGWSHPHCGVCCFQTCAAWQNSKDFISSVVSYSQ